MEHFTIEEQNLICIYMAGNRSEIIEDMTGAPPYMDEEMRALADRTLTEPRAMCDAEFAAQAIDFTDDDAGE
ncbi:MAG: transposon-transfer assisting family protein [Cloacibacillus sp.]